MRPDGPDCVLGYDWIRLLPDGRVVTDGVDSGKTWTGDGFFLKIHYPSNANRPQGGAFVCEREAAEPSR